MFSPWIILAWLLMVAGLLGTLLPFLPGTILIWIGALVYGWATEFRSVDGWLLLGLAALVGLAHALGFLSGALGAKGFGASNWGIAGAILGGVAGLLTAGVIGVFLGPLVGAVLGELISGRRLPDALRSGVGGTIGALGGMLSNFLVGLVMVGLVILKVV